MDADHLEDRDVSGSYKEDLKEVGWDGLYWSYLASCGDQWQGPRLSQILGISWQSCCQFSPEGQCLEPAVRTVWGAWLGSDQVGPRCWSLVIVPYL